MLETYRLEQRGDVFDLVHISMAYVSGRRMALREILRANIPAAEVQKACPGRATHDQ